MDGLARPTVAHLCGRGLACALAGLVFSAMALGCSDEPEVTKYSSEVRPIFQTRCVICHRPGSVSGGGILILDLESPFSGDRGLVNATNTWAEVNPGIVADQVVVPGDPDNSFLMNKITGDLPAGGEGGGMMPPRIEPLSEEELALLEQWVADGAQNDQFFRDNIQLNIFGDGTVSVRGTCAWCHYEGTPNPPNLVNPFDPENGAVNVVASYRSDYMRVVPGDPDASLLIQKVRLGTREDTQTREAISRFGVPMPYQFAELNEEQVQDVRDWIAEGALDN